MISFVLFPQASVPSLNFSKSFSDDFVSKTLFTWSGGPRSSGVTFYCPPERDNKRKQPH